ncbi:uncharacterized protein CTRU02_215346 [Colletotrichum truncatum]|uniref:Uncharacterized protein n=1 Tax=Colletotrichum truncatum TaxID=5467 RepID=A0ACC3YCY9_COLTU
MNSVRSLHLDASSPSAPRLPPEIIDAIIDEIDNLVDLMSMARLCRLYTDYALKICYQRYFKSRGLPWISRLLWPALHYDDPLKDEPSAEAEARALLMLKRGTPFCKPDEMWYFQPPNASDISYLYFNWNGAISTGYCYGRYPILHFAAYAGLDSIVEHLVSNGADVNATPYQYTSEEDVFLSHLTPLFMAAYGGSLKSARLLLDCGARIEKSWVAALQSGSAALVQLMIERDPSILQESITIGRKTMNPFSAVLDLSKCDPLPVIETLVANGADTTYMNAFNRNVRDTPRSRSLVTTCHKANLLISL